MKKAMMSQLSKTLLIAAAVAGLAACGQGNKTTSTAASTTSTSTSTAASSSTATTPKMTDLAVSSSMTWQTQTAKSAALTIKKADGSVDGGAVVRLFSYTTKDPHGGSTPTEPVPVGQIDAAQADTNGVVRFEAKLPAHMTDVLVVVNGSKGSFSKVVPVADLATTTLSPS